MKTYAQFREELEKLAIEYASECNAAMSIKIDVTLLEIQHLKMMSYRCII